MKGSVTCSIFSIPFFFCLFHASTRGGRGQDTYSIAGGVLLLGADDGAAALGGVEGAATADDALALRSAAADTAADLGRGLPVEVRHLVSVGWSV